MAHIQCGRKILRQIVHEASLKRCDGFVNPLPFAAQGIGYRKLQVILTTSIDKHGMAGETVKVSPGYFRNYLMPKLVAVPNIEKFAYLVREQRKIYQYEEEEGIKVVQEAEEDKMAEYIAAAKRLDNAKVEVPHDDMNPTQPTEAKTELKRALYSRSKSRSNDPVRPDPIQD